MENQELKEILRGISKRNDMDFFGVGSVDRWSGAPVGHRPADVLPNAKSVIVMGVKIPEGCIRENIIAYNGMRHGILPYMVYGYNMLNDFLEEAAFKMADYLNSIEYEVFLPPASVGREEDRMMGIISNRHSAVAAGLAEFGLNGLALTPEAGPRVRWVIIVTDADLPADPLYHGPRICHDCMHCINVCPVQAFNSNEKWEFQIAEKDCSYCKLNRVVCRTAQTGLAKGSSGRLQMEINKNEMVTVNDWLKLVKSDNKWNRLERVAAMCGRCMIECTAGIPFHEREAGKD
jgi:epoxyqueuosine reductase QueG